ncbi:hypothetical protein TYRP_017205 [Tyrophagus putrescentiae]|nr:hypothetical protein TYRP_017205 [Tyrophagus putrescentiae]
MILKSTVLATVLEHYVAGGFATAKCVGLRSAGAPVRACFKHSALLRRSVQHVEHFAILQPTSAVQPFWTMGTGTGRFRAEVVSRITS